jgi:hypothetical protein
LQADRKTDTPVLTYVLLEHYPTPREGAAMTHDTSVPDAAPHYPAAGISDALPEASQKLVADAVTTGGERSLAVIVADLSKVVAERTAVLAGGAEFDQGAGLDYSGGELTISARA